MKICLCVMRFRTVLESTALHGITDRRQLFDGRRYFRFTRSIGSKGSKWTQNISIFMTSSIISFSSKNVYPAYKQILIFLQTIRMRFVSLCEMPIETKLPISILIRIFKHYFSVHPVPESNDAFPANQSFKWEKNIRPMLSFIRFFMSTHPRKGHGWTLWTHGP